MKKIKICPKCKSPRIKPAMNVSGWLAPDLYECRDCNYVGSLYLEMDLEEYEQMKKKEQEKSK
ncbi:MAG: TFIIB-type zinc ribbon-containing protein [Promethearchaeota archaeon]